MGDVRTEVVERLAKRDALRTEADIQGDIYALLTAGGLNLTPGQVARLEVPTRDGTRRRLDVEVGHAVIEVKKDLRSETVRQEAEKQLAGYVVTRTESIGRRYVGILTDGADWYLYRLAGDSLEEVASLLLGQAQLDPDHLVTWLEAILATEESIRPTPEEIKRRLGAESPAHLLDHGSLLSLYRNAAAKPEVELKRQLWAKLLRTSFGKAFEDDERLFINHTLLVLSAEVIAHAVVGFDVTATSSLTPQALARGTAFNDSLIHGVVEADFFDWVLEVDGGPSFIQDLAKRIGRFDWGEVEHDVLKVLYESIISANSRASLGEYYTPDWLADRVVADAVTSPLEQRVLDPACGSGTFLFHAIRAYLKAADAAEIPNGEAVGAVTSKVFGMDVHPVAVTLARVTYLMAIGRDRLAAEDRGPISVPVYLGDSLQWEQHRDLFGGVDTVTVTTTGDDLVDGGNGVLFGDDLVFPRSVLNDASTFDQLVSAMADRAQDTSKRTSKSLAAAIIRQFGVHEHDAEVIERTFTTMRRLHASGRNHIWGYYVRNLIRPLWLSEDEQQFDTLIGNPPWLRYSKMTAGMKKRFNDMAKARSFFQGGLGASGRDLSTLFVARAVELYLKRGGNLSFVMPHGVLTRKPHERFRSGSWSSSTSSVSASFEEAWDLSAAPTGFPMVSCVIRATKTKDPKRVPNTAVLWSARFKRPTMSWDAVSDKFSIASVALGVTSEDDATPVSPYKRRFRQGAVLAPRVLLFVVEGSSGPLGAGAGRRAVKSRRTNLEDKRWKDVPSLQGVVEASFVRNIYLGENILPFRPVAPLQAVLPISQNKLMTADEIDSYPALASWWSKAEESWGINKVENDKSALLDRINFHGQLAAQLPAVSNRVVFTKAGNKLAAARVVDRAAIIDHKLYWAAVSSAEEALYLTAVLNSGAVMERVAPLQARGLFGGRDIDKNVFAVPIPVYDSNSDDHRKLAELAKEAESSAEAIDISSTGDFKRARGIVREGLKSLYDEIDQVVLRIIAPL